MDEKLQGILTFLALLIAGLRPTFPTDALLLVCGVMGMILLESFRVRLARSLAFNPAAAFYLGLAILPEFGTVTPALVLIVYALARSKRPLSENLALELGTAFGLAAANGCHFLAPENKILPFVLVPATYLGVSWVQGRTVTLPVSGEERALWYALHLRIKPLELAQAWGAAATGLLAGLKPRAPLLLCPVFCAGRLAAENVRNRVREERVEELSQTLKGVAQSKEKAERQLNQAQQNVQLLEGFSRHLSSKPALAETASSLLDTVVQVVPSQTAALFLGSPPEPYLCRGSQDHRDALQASSLTALREPVVDRARTTGQPVYLKKLGPASDRLFKEDNTGVALPIGRFGTLYLGRSDGNSFHRSELDQLTWFAQKAELALNSAFTEQETRREKRRLHQTLVNLEDRLSWMTLLLQAAEAMASTLDRKALQQRFAETLQASIPHQAGVCRLEDGICHSWGASFQLPPTLAEKVEKSQSVFVLAELSKLETGSLDDFESLVAIRLQEPTSGQVVLLSKEPRAFSQTHVNFLSLLSAQFSMALHNSHLYADVVEARERLQESQAQLVQSSKMTAMGQLSAGVAHEINTPLGAISLTLEDLLYSVEDHDHVTSGLKLALEAVDKANKIIERLMTYSRKPSGEMKTLALESLVEEALDFVGGQLRALGSRVESSLAPGCQVVGEWQSLSQAFLNLLLNAAQSMQEKPAEQRVLRVLLEKGQDRVTLRVVDCGEGITEENLERIFEPFFTTKPVGKGTGLGLWAAHRIVTEHGGTLTVDSELGKGTAVELKLPLGQGV